MSAKRKRRPSEEKKSKRAVVEYTPPPPPVFKDIDTSRHEGLVGSIQKAKGAARTLVDAIDRVDTPTITGTDVTKLSNESKKAILEIEGVVHFICWVSAELWKIPPD